MALKFKLTTESIVKFGKTYYRIEALISFSSPFGDVKKGDRGGYVQTEENLSQYGNAWVVGNAWVGGNASVSGNAWVVGNAWVGDRARVGGNAWVGDNARVGGNAWVVGNARVGGEAWVDDNARVGGEAWVGGNAWVVGNARVGGEAWVGQPFHARPIIRSDGYAFIITPSKDGPPRVIAGCRNFTMVQARDHWHRTRGGTKLGDETMAILDCLERIATIHGFIEPAAMPPELISDHDDKGAEADTGA